MPATRSTTPTSTRISFPMIGTTARTSPTPPSLTAIETGSATHVTRPTTPTSTRISFPTTATIAPRLPITKQLDADRDGLGDACDDTPTGDSTILAVTITPDGTEIAPGESLAFETTVRNAGSTSATDVALTETLPSGIEWVANSNDFDDCLISGVELTCTDDLLPVGGSRTVTVSGTLPEEVTSCDLDLSTTATAEADNAALVTDAGSYTVVCLPDVTISKTAVADDITAGGEIGFTITVTNTGPGAASDVAFSDDLPATGGEWSLTSPIPLPGDVECPITDGTLTCTGIALDAVTGTFSLMVSSTLPAVPTAEVCAGISNTAMLSAPFDGASSASVTVDCPDVAITKAAVDDEVSAGEDIGFTITVENTGTAAAPDVGFTDVLPVIDGHTWTVTDPVTLPDEVGCPITDGTLTCSGIDLDATTGSFSVTVSSTLPTVPAADVCANGISNSATLSVPYAGDATAIVAVICAPDVTISKTGPETVAAGNAIDFTITVANSGSTVATDVRFTDQLPDTGGDWAITSPVTLPDGVECPITDGSLDCTGIVLEAGTGTFSVTVSSTLPADPADDVCDGISNTATLSVPYAGDATATVAVTCPNVTITKAAENENVPAGDLISFTITVANSGDADATDVDFTDTLPDTGYDWEITAPATLPDAVDCRITDGTLDCTGIDLAADGGAFSVTVSSDTATDGTTCGTYENTATLTNYGEASSETASVSVTCAPDVTISKTATADEVNAGEDIGFIITVANEGSAEATDVGFTDALPVVAGQTWAITAPAPIPDGVDCQVTDGTLTCSGIDLDATTGSFSVTVSSTLPTVPAADVCADGISNTATLSAPYDGESTASVTVACPNVTITKAAVADEATAGDDIGFIITATNDGTAEATDVGFEDALPLVADQTWAISDPVTLPDDVDCAITDGTLDCSGIELDPLNGAFAITVTSATTAASDTTSCDTTQTYDNSVALSDPYDGDANASVDVSPCSPEVRCEQTAIAAQIDPAFYNVVVGTSGNDNFNASATAGQDLYCGFGGVDSVDGLPDGDVFFGGVDNDLVGTVNGGQFIAGDGDDTVTNLLAGEAVGIFKGEGGNDPVSYTHLRAHETVLDLVCRLLLEKKKN